MVTLRNEPLQESQHRLTLLERDITEISEILRVISHPTRIQVLAFVSLGESSFMQLHYKLEIQKTTLSNHLQTLVANKLISKLQRGTYQITETGNLLLEYIAEFNYKRIELQIASFHGHYLRKYPKVEEIILTENKVRSIPTFEPTWMSFNGAIAGVLKSFGEKIDAVDVGGYSGNAFLLNVSTKNTHVSAPTTHAFWEEVHKGTESMGYTLNGYWDAGAFFPGQSESLEDTTRLEKLQNYVKSQINQNNPVVLWGPGAAEFGIVYGYNEKEYLVSTFRQGINIPDDPVTFDAIVSPGGLWAYHLGTNKKEMSEVHDKDAIARAVRMLSGTDLKGGTPGTPSKDGWQVDKMEFVGGIRSYDTWIAHLEEGGDKVIYMGNSYVANCTRENKEDAAAFLKRFANKYSNREFSQDLLRASEFYSEIAKLLKSFCDLYPFAMSGETSDETNSKAADILKEVVPLEKKAFEALVNVRDNWD